MRHIALAAASAVALIAMPASGQDTFPVTLDHFYGETVIEAKAERIVTISWMAQDTVLALGEVPIAIQSQTWGGDENGYLPWVKEAIEELGEDVPVALDTANGLPFEQILELEPDLILAPYSGISQDDYDRLSAIAPTVAFKEAPWTGSWQYVVETVGAAMGRSEEASGLVDSTQDRIAEYAAENPQFAGRTFAFGGGSDAGSVGLYVPSDPRVHLMEDLGLVPAEALNDLPTDNYVQQVSFEQLDGVDAEVFIAWYSSQDDLDAILSNPLFARWKPIANDNFVPLIDRAFVMAVSAPSPLSIPWMMDRFVPILAETLEQ